MKQYRGNELKALRKAAGLTGPKAADICGVKYRTFWAWESNTNPVTDLAWETIQSRLEAHK